MARDTTTSCPARCDFFPVHRMKNTSPMLRYDPVSRVGHSIDDAARCVLNIRHFFFPPKNKGFNPMRHHRGWFCGLNKGVSIHRCISAHGCGIPTEHEIAKRYVFTELVYTRCIGLLNEKNSFEIRTILAQMTLNSEIMLGAFNVRQSKYRYLALRWRDRLIVMGTGGTDSQLLRPNDLLSAQIVFVVRCEYRPVYRPKSLDRGYRNFTGLIYKNIT